jgi:hypothetical protein
MSDMVFNPPAAQRALAETSASRSQTTDRAHWSQGDDQQTRSLPERDRAGHRNESNSNAFFLKARTLLTRHWYPSSWRSRTNILRNAEWQVRVGARSDRAESSSPDGI